jgi:hypothetical protein
VTCEVTQWLAWGSNCRSKVGYFGKTFMHFLVLSVQNAGLLPWNRPWPFLCCSLLHFLLYVIYGIPLVWLHATRRRIAVIGNYCLKLNHKLMFWMLMWRRTEKISRFDYTGWFKKVDTISYVYISWTAVQRAFRLRFNIQPVVFENLGPFLSNAMWIIHIPCIVQEI